MIICLSFFADSKNKNQLQHQIQQQQHQQNVDGTVGVGNQQGGGGNGMQQDPINALQNLASHQGNRGPMPPQMMSICSSANQMNIGVVGVGGQSGSNTNVLQSLINVSADRVHCACYWSRTHI